MKHLFVLFILLFALVSSAQVEAKHEISCDSIHFDIASGIFEYIGNANFETDILKIGNAEKIIFKKKTNEILASGLMDFAFDGSVHVANSNHTKNLRYKIGDSIVYFE